MLINFEHISKSYGERQLLSDVTFYLKPGDKLGVVGVNGSGKSTLLKIAAGKEFPDSGKISSDPNVRISYLPQIPEDNINLTVLEQVISGQPENARELAAYEAEEFLNKLGITDTNQKIGTLSGGQRKRAALAQCLVTPADVLILDEPTNHLDMEMNSWLEDRLSRFPGAVLFVSHDRYFLEHVATQTAEVSFGHVYLTDGGYSSWLDAKSRREEMAAASERKRQSILRRELLWVLQGPCARGTKSRERLERYAALKSQLPPEMQAKLGEIKTVSSRLGKKTIELNHVSKWYEGREIIPFFDFMLLRDDRVGIIGGNGSGKSTLLNIISGRITPDTGTISCGETVKIGYFTQHSDELNGNQTAIEYVKEFGERIETSDGYLSAEKLMELFLFPGELQHRLVSKLSGGEKRRLYLLGILASAPNVLLLDEPTNDLDIPTLQVLEDYLETFPGAIVAVSHDRYFLDRICRRVFILSPGHEIRQFNGGYTDYTELESLSEAAEKSSKPKPEKAQRSSSHSQKLKFTFKEQREFETIEDDIAVLETKLSEISSEQEKYSTDYIRLQELTEQQLHTEAELEEKMDRWVYLNDLAEKIKAQQNTL